MTGLDVRALTNALASEASKLGVFTKVNGHEPKNAPGKGVTLSIWLDQIRPASSGLRETSALVVFNARVQSPMLAEPADDIDPKIAEAAGVLIGALHARLTLGGLVRSIDVFGSQGVPLGGQAGYIEQDRREYRVFTLAIPLIINDVWPQTP